VSSTFLPPRIPRTYPSIAWFVLNAPSNSTTFYSPTTTAATTNKKHFESVESPVYRSLTSQTSEITVHQKPPHKTVNKQANMADHDEVVAKFTELTQCTPETVSLILAICSSWPSASLTRIQHLGSRSLTSFKLESGSMSKHRNSFSNKHHTDESSNHRML